MWGSGLFYQLRFAGVRALCLGGIHPGGHGHPCCTCGRSRPGTRTPHSVRSRIIPVAAPAWIRAPAVRAPSWTSGSDGLWTQQVRAVRVCRSLSPLWPALGCAVRELSACFHLRLDSTSEPLTVSVLVGPLLFCRTVRRGVPGTVLWDRCNGTPVCDRRVPSQQKARQHTSAETIPPVGWVSC